MKYLTKRTIVAAILGTTVIAGVAFAQSTGHDDVNHATHMASEPEAMPSQGSFVLSEPGQGAFAALSEVVQTLEADPNTDWSAVTLTALRDHLIDMDRLVRDSVVKEETLPNGLRAIVTGDAATLATAKRMVPAHAFELSKDTRWQVEVQDNGSEVILTVVSDNPATAARIAGLGFFGLMASQDHHREHHMRIAHGGSHDH